MLQNACGESRGTVNSATSSCWSIGGRSKDKVPEKI